MTVLFFINTFTTLFRGDFDPATKRCKSDALHVDGAESSVVASDVRNIVIIGSSACAD
jgi:hypothetical protein